MVAWSRDGQVEEVSYLWKALVLGVAVGLSAVGALYDRVRRDLHVLRVIRIVYRQTREVD